MILIAESGSTRTEWAIIEGNYVIGHEFTGGINPFFQTRREISHSVRLGLPKLFFKKRYDQVYFYGAGCTTDDRKEIIKASLVAQFKSPIQVESDLLAAARGLFKKEAGIACILGTGSNSCFYDGEKIIKNVRSLGYILGDEGSGAIMGRMFLADCLKELAPKEIIEDFYNKFHITSESALDSVYSDSFPNRFLSDISFFLSSHLDNSYVYNLIYSNIRSFFIRNICQYNYKNYPIRFVGSVAYLYADILKEVAKELNIEISSIAETSMKGLVDYHSQTYIL
ncbi:hypothetical protein [uncultured Bacteroides sp.]|uniref:hypothetical protein n=1 Tax=uncultured Bacteroides sp. TaxID=162156 RepID=UPI002AAA6BC5|nr:hypothetical protein [uncultured Bacteroides sp.]